MQAGKQKRIVSTVPEPDQPRSAGRNQAMLLMVLILAFFLFCSTSHAESAVLSDYFDVRKGDLPVLLTAPHGGKERPVGIQKRTSSGGFDPDADTDRLTLELSKEIENISGKSPYLVVARLHRDLIDLNRPRESMYMPEYGTSENAYDDPEAGKYYTFYHASIMRLIDEMAKKYPHGSVLIDIHGHGLPGPEYGTIIFGSLQGTSMAKTNSTCGNKATGLIPERMQKSGYIVNANHYMLTGGYTVWLYSQFHRKIDAFLIEVPPNLRSSRNARCELVQDLAGAIMDFYRDCLAK
jgi:N-formylglutamate amidohydrolase